MRDFTDLIREARTEEEKLAVYRFRYEIYIEEMGKPYKCADHVNRTLRDELDATATILYVEIDGSIKGTVRTNWGKDEKSFEIFNNPNFGLDRFDRFAPKSFSFNSRFMVSPCYRTSRLGLDLARASYRIGLQQRVVFNFIKCKPSLLDFFERLGFQRYKDEFLDETVGIQVPMVFFLEDTDYLRQIRSPFLDKSDAINESPMTLKLLVPVNV